MTEFGYRGAARLPVGVVDALDAATRSSALDALIQHEIVDESVAHVGVVGWARRDAATSRWSVVVGGAGGDLDAIFDLASLTKPLTAIAAFTAIAAGRMQLDERVGDRLPALGELAAAQCPLRQLLSHRAGVPAWGVLYRADPWGVRSPASVPFDGSDATFEHLLSRAASRCERATAAMPHVYSDIGYILAGALVAEALGGPCALASDWEATCGATSAARHRARLGIEFDERVLPTEIVAWRGGVVRGVVHDENACAIEQAGHVGGHAGAFGTIRETLAVGMSFADALSARAPSFLASADAESMIAPIPGGTHTLGWDRVTVGASSSGHRFGPRAFGHLGFTGTSLWADPDAGVVAALLTNRTYPSRDNDRIRRARPRIHDALWAIDERR